MFYEYGLRKQFRILVEKRLYLLLHAAAEQFQILFLKAETARSRVASEPCEYVAAVLEALVQVDSGDGSSGAFKQAVSGGSNYADRSVELLLKVAGDYSGYALVSALRKYDRRVFSAVTFGKTCPADADRPFLLRLAFYVGLNGKTGLYDSGTAG